MPFDAINASFLPDDDLSNLTDEELDALCRELDGPCERPAIGRAKRAKSAKKPCTKSSRPTRRRRRSRTVDFLSSAITYPARTNPRTEPLSLERIPPPSHTHQNRPLTPHPTPPTKNPASPLPTPLLPPTSPKPSTTTKHQAPPLQALFKRDKANVPPRWDEADELLKATFFHREIAKLQGTSFTLNLSPEIEAAAKADPTSFTAHVRRRLARSLKKSFGHPVPFWFAIDISAHGRPHLHGGIAMSRNDLGRLTEALQRAGGKWAARRGKEHQVALGTRLDDAWARYATKAIRPKAQAEFGKMLTVTDEILRPARIAFEEARARALSGLSVAP